MQASTRKQPTPRILPRKRRGDDAPVTSAAVAEALRRFRAAGGLVQELPADPTPTRRTVGGHHASYENVLDY